MADAPDKAPRSAARFPVIATMDGDGQNDPADIMPLYRKLGGEGPRARHGRWH